MSEVKLNLIYIMPHIDRIGEVADQLFVLRNLFPDDKYSKTIITYPLESKPGVNKEVFTIASRGMNVVYSTDHNLLWSCYHGNNVNNLIASEDGKTIYAMFNCSEIRSRYFQEFQNRKPEFLFSLTPDELSVGEKLQKAFGIPEEARIITLHVRDGACFNPDADDKYRNARLTNYLPAIQHLVDRGYYVIRLGDRRMQPLKMSCERIIDAPFHPAYTGLVEPYFISKSSFFLGTQSGPISLAEYFGVPAIFSNTPIQAHQFTYEKDIMLFKNYYSHQLKRALSYEEILTSPCPDFFRDHLFEQSGIELIENTPDEILATVKEMIAVLEDRHYPDKNTLAAYRQIEAIHKRIDLYRRSFCDREMIPYIPLFPPLGSPARISQAYLDLNPHFLGHRWPDVKHWGWEPELEK